MTPEIMGIPLERFEEPIRDALEAYQRLSYFCLIFDSDLACKLQLTPDKPNSARSESDVRHSGNATETPPVIGKLYVIAFKPGDGTGSEADYKLDNLVVEPPYPRKSLVVPRNKKGVHSEGHLTIARHKFDDSHAGPELFAGTFDLLGLKGNRVKKIGKLGHSEIVFDPKPIVTYTVGYKEIDANHETRFGDPHAVYSRLPDYVQVCAFFAISDQLSRDYAHALRSLNPKLPRGI